MKCFNHPEREAVATCQKCGKGLCRECAGKYTPCLCDSCAAQIQRNQQQQAQSKEDQRKQKYKAALVDTRSEFIKTAVIGIVLGIFFVWVVAQGYGSDLIGYVLYFCFGLCLPFGWKLLTYVQSFFPITIIGTFGFWFVWCVFKAVFSVIVGIPAFVYQLIKTISAQNKINNIK